MKITFIDPTHSITNYGLRTLSQYLLNAGHDVNIIFMNQPSIRYNYEYPESVLDDLYKLVKDSDLIGFSFVSNYLGHAKSLSKKIKQQFNIPIIWGGIHAIADPEQSLETADLVCVGEGEECVLQLAKDMDANLGYHNVPNLWFKENNTIICNEPAHINSDVDSYSLPLYDNSREFIRTENGIVRMNNELRKKITGVATNYYSINEETTYPYLTLSSRGCPNSCSYCCNNLFKKIYKGKGKLLRRRSNPAVIEELEVVIKRMPYINLIEFFDDDFIFTDEKTISEFAELYKRKINLPFRCNFRPESVTYEKIKLLYDAGLISIEMGLQSASAVTNKLYKRHFKKDIFLKAANILNKFKNIISHYDIIVDNPFENYEDIQQTLRFISELPEPYRIAIFSLTFFPGTQLYEYAKTKGLVKNEIKNIFNKKNYVQYEYKQPYIKFLLLYIRVIGFKTPGARIVFKSLTNVYALKIFDSFLFYPLWVIVLFSKRTLSKIKHPEIKLIPG